MSKGPLKHMRAEEVHNNKIRQIDPHASSACDVSWRDEVLTPCSGSQHTSSLPVEGAGRAPVSAPPAPWSHALVVTGVVRHRVCCLILTRDDTYA